MKNSFEKPFSEEEQISEEERRRSEEERKEEGKEKISGTEKEFKQKLQNNLEYLRKGVNSILYKDHIEYIREEISKGRFTLEDIGTNEEELEQLRIKGCKEAAEGWLMTLRKNPYEYEAFLKYIHEELQNGKLTLQDIGTNQEELEQLRKESDRLRNIKIRNIK